MSVEPFNRLVKLVARAFYDDVTMKGDSQPKTGRYDSRGMAVVVLDALTRRQWVREEDLARSLKLNSKLLRRILRFFEEEKLIQRDLRKESAKGSKVFVSAVAAVNGGDDHKEGEEKPKMHIHSYCCLDYAQIIDVVRYRLLKMKKKLEGELDSGNTIATYICPNCNRKYSAYDAPSLLSLTDGNFHCENCDGEVVAETDKLASEEMGDDARKRSREKVKALLQKIDEQLKPLIIQLERVKDLPVPDFGTLAAWEARASLAARAEDTNHANKNRNQNPGYGGTPMPYIGETRVEVAFSGMEAEQEDSQTDSKAPVQKVLPPWMIKKGMVLTKEQRGETSGHDSKSNGVEDEKQDSKEDEETRLQDEYVKQYYATLVRAQEEAAKKTQQQQLDENLFGSPETSMERRDVGMKAKREDNDDDNAGSPYKFTPDLNLEPEESEEDDADDDIDWEEG